ncbi:hypothetical protein MNBD_GAMMA09-727 [hydrothermal vent metagenome]|uniref:Hemerythrin-like domain-containing protein n=1 Tax=hydrothermal vent metagenome TaxID=652676 RepID=A0A3B0XE09_9ZZZZ
MKRINQLQPLSKEHHQSLRLAKKCRDVINTKSNTDIIAFAVQLKNDFNTQWKKHFLIEEKYIFSTAKSKGGEISEICQRLEKEHRRLEALVEKISAGDIQLLPDFGALLHDHTRMEERKLFPMVEDTFTPAELDNIIKNKPGNTSQPKNHLNKPEDKPENKPEG